MEELLERLSEVVAALEAAAEQLREREVSLSAKADERIGHLVATAESEREAELARRLQAAEAKLVEAEGRLAELSAAAANLPAGRKTAAVGMLATLGKQGISASALEGLESRRMEAGSLDAALASLSIEQRFAVKAEMLRSGLLG